MTPGQRSPRVDLIAVRATLPVGMAATLDAYERHLRLEANRSEHTVRAYVGDVVGLLDHLRKLGGTSAGQLELGTLRGWLAIQRNAGVARTTLARRSASLRTFTAWLRRAGHTATWEPSWPVRAVIAPCRPCWTLPRRAQPWSRPPTPTTRSGTGIV